MGIVVALVNVIVLVVSKVVVILRWLNFIESGVFDDTISVYIMHREAIDHVDEEIPNLEDTILNDANPVIDTTEHFNTALGFENRTELVEWVNGVGRNIGVVTVIGRSECLSSHRSARVDLICERGGKYDNKPRKKDKEKKGLQKRQIVNTHELASIRPQSNRPKDD
ncbi:hypothetical protein QJS10_CPA03g01314 [Acorus calamus]|uniref:Uncharacterized protein n=1 Tax=Acorus calamus TaxID=4465 RepID=A0AAV9FC03_ACOCL|nr:hypothetical protein QJS10_CPA03g01314 [Acorus calamus]